MNHNRTIGTAGEALAVEWLSRRGFEVLDRNWRHGRCEIDIIALQEGVLHFVEVKTRTSLAFGQPEERVSRVKIRAIIRASTAWQAERKCWKPVCFDILSITMINSEPGFFFIRDVYV